MKYKNCDNERYVDSSECKFKLFYNKRKEFTMISAVKKCRRVQALVQDKSKKFSAYTIR